MSKAPSNYILIPVLRDVPALAQNPINSPANFSLDYNCLPDFTNLKTLSVCYKHFETKRDYCHIPGSSCINIDGLLGSGVKCVKGIETWTASGATFVMNKDILMRNGRKLSWDTDIRNVVIGGIWEGSLDFP